MLLRTPISAVPCESFNEVHILQSADRASAKFDKNKTKQKQIKFHQFTFAIKRKKNREKKENS